MAQLDKDTDGGAQQEAEGAEVAGQGAEQGGQWVAGQGAEAEVAGHGAEQVGRARQTSASTHTFCSWGPRMRPR